MWLPRREFSEFVDDLSGDVLSGKVISRAPRWSATASIGYGRLVAGLGELSADLDYNYMSNPTPLKIDVTRYFRMEQAGIFGEDGRGSRGRIELIEGEILEIPRPNPPHSSAVAELNRLLIDAIPRSRAIVWCQSTVVLSRFTAPQPDFVLLPPNDHRFRERHPRPEDIWLAIEVADTSLAYDRGRKSKLYASSGIAEYWLLDLPGRALEIRRQPAADGYGILRRAAAGELIPPAAPPECLLDWARVFA